MEAGETALLLSDSLKCVKKCPTFDKSLTGESYEDEVDPQGVTKYTLEMVDLVSNQIEEYLHSLQEILMMIQYADIPDKFSYGWIEEGRSQIFEMHRNIQVIDVVISGLLDSVEENMTHDIDGDESTDLKFDNTLEKLNSLLETSLEIKKFVLFYKKRADVSAQYNELNRTVMGSISREVDSCIAEYKKLQEFRSSSSESQSPTFDLETIIQKIRVPLDGSASLTENLRLPTFNGIDELLYNKYCKLQERIQPLSASLMFIPFTIDQFSDMARAVYPNKVKQLLETYNDLVVLLQTLETNMVELKKDLIDQRWEKIFKYLTDEVSFLIENLENQLDRHTPKESINNHTIEIINQTLNIVRRAIAEGLSKDSALEKHQVQLSERFSFLQGRLSANFVSVPKDDKFFDISMETVNVEEYYEITEPFNLTPKKKPLNISDTNNNPGKKQVGDRIVSALQVRPVYHEYNIASTRKDPEMNYRILENTLKHNEFLYGEKKNNNLLNKLMKEFGDEENIQISDDMTCNEKENKYHEVVNNMQTLNLKDDKTTPVRPVVGSSFNDPFVTPTLRDTKSKPTLAFNASEKNIVSLEVSKRRAKSETRKPPQLKPTTARPSRIPVPITSLSANKFTSTSPTNMTTRVNNIPSSHNYIPHQRPLSKLEQLGVEFQSKLGTKSTPLPSLNIENSRVSVRSSTSLGIQSTPRSLPPPTPLRVMQETARSQSSLGIRPSRPTTGLRQRRDFSNPIRYL